MHGRMVVRNFSETENIVAGLDIDTSIEFICPFNLENVAIQAGIITFDQYKYDTEEAITKQHFSLIPTKVKQSFNSQVNSGCDGQRPRDSPVSMTKADIDIVLQCDHINRKGFVRRIHVSRESSYNGICL